MTGKANRLPYFFLGGPDCRYSVMIGTAGAGGGPLRSESARRLTPEIRHSKFPETPRPSVTLALAAPGPPVQLRWTTLRVQGPTLRDAALATAARICRALCDLAGDAECGGVRCITSHRITA